MKPLNQKTIAELVEEGYAIIFWTPEELGSANPRKVEESLIEYGLEIIDVLGDDK